MIRYLINMIVVMILAIFFLAIFNTPRLYFLSDYMVIKQNIIKFFIFIFIPIWILIINFILEVKNLFNILFSLLIGLIAYIYLGDFFFKRIYFFNLYGFTSFYLVLSVISVNIYIKKIKF